jgi:hypothetical protein
MAVGAFMTIPGLNLGNGSAAGVHQWGRANVPVRAYLKLARRHFPSAVWGAGALRDTVTQQFLQSTPLGVDRRTQQPNPLPHPPPTQRQYFPARVRL